MIRTNIVYSMNCKDCDVCYIIQTSQYLKCILIQNGYNASNENQIKTELSRHIKTIIYNTAVLHLHLILPTAVSTSELTPIIL